MNRYFLNLFTGRWYARKMVSAGDQDVIERAIVAAESDTSAQIKVVIEASISFSALLRGQSARERALEVFGAERVWDTSGNNGILLYLLLAERDAEIVVDRGFNGIIGDSDWMAVCERLESEVASLGFVSAVVNAVERIGKLAKASYPSSDHTNELPNEVKIR